MLTMANMSMEGLTDWIIPPMHSLDIILEILVLTHCVHLLFIIRKNNNKDNVVKDNLYIQRVEITDQRV